MKSKDKSAFVPWLSHGPSRWMLVLGLLSGTLSCASETSQSEEPIAASETQADSQSSEDSDLLSDKDQQETSTETIGSLTPEETANPSGEDSIEKTLASLSKDDSPSDSYKAPEPPSVEPSSKSFGTKSLSTGKNSTVGSATPTATYVVAAGDSLTKIAKKIFGQTKFWEEIAALNELNPPFKIYPGQGLRYPLVNAHGKTFAEAYRKTQKTITVQKGDSLSKLAAKVFGTQDSWQKLFNYNKDKIMDPNVLPAGITLAYFDGASATPVNVQPAAQPKVEITPVSAPAPAAQPKVEPAPAKAPAAPKLLPPAPKAPLPQVKQALKAKALHGKPLKKTTKGQTKNKKTPAKGAKSSIKISPNDLNSP
jgi:nucleoid-associated protein YgaU